MTRSSERRFWMRAGDTFVLRNRSGHAVRFNAAGGTSAGIAGNLTAMRVS